MTLSRLIAQDATNSLQGLKEDPIPPFSGTGGGIGFAAVFQMLLALVIVVLLVRWLVPKYAAKLSKRFTTNAGTDLLVQESASIAGHQIVLVKARGRTLLVGASSSGLTLLADLTEEPGYLNLPSPPVNSGPAQTSPDERDFDRVLERLNRLQR